MFQAWKKEGAPQEDARRRNKFWWEMIAAAMMQITLMSDREGPSEVRFSLDLDAYQRVRLCKLATQLEVKHEEIETAEGDTAVKVWKSGKASGHK